MSSNNKSKLIHERLYRLGDADRLEWFVHADEAGEQIAEERRPTHETLDRWHKLDETRHRRITEMRNQIVHLSGRVDEEAQKTIEELLGNPEAAQLVVFEDIAGFDGDESVKSVVERAVDAEMVTRTLADGHVLTHLRLTQKKVEEELRRAVGAGSVANVLDSWATFLPARIVNEELGDYLEDITRRAADGQRFRVYLRMVMAMFWTGVNALGYYRKQVGNTKSVKL